MKISVCMATYNGEKYLKEQLDSILVQLKKGDELIVSDDGSSDETLSILKGYNDSRIKIFHSEKSSIVKNFENALTNASGELIFLTDQDDIWFDNKVEVMEKKLKKYDLVFSNAAVFSANINQTNLLYPVDSSRTGFLKNFIKNNYVGATMAFHSKLLKIALPFPSRIHMHDVWIALITECKSQTYFISEPLIYYRRHNNNASETGSKSSNTFGLKLKMRANLLYSLIKRLI